MLKKSLYRYHDCVGYLTIYVRITPTSHDFSIIEALLILVKCLGRR